LGVTLAATAAIGAAGLTGPAQAAPAPASASGSTAPNVAVEWNRTLLDLVQKPGAQPATIQPTRDFAILGSAVYDAVQAVDRHRHPGQVTNAAAAQAAHDVLTATFPAFTVTLNQQLASDLAAVHSGRARAEGVRAGADAAVAVLHARADDGSGVTPPPYQTSGLPGDFRPTPPAFAAPVFTHWGAVTPFVLRSGDQFRPPAPPSLRSRAYAAAVNEVKALGRDTSTLRTAEQTTIARFWAGPIQNYWYAIADEIAVARHEDTATSARTFALLD